MTPTTKPDGATPEQIAFVETLSGAAFLPDEIAACRAVVAELRTLRQHNASLSGAGDILSATLHEQEAENTALRQANADLLAADKGRQGVVAALRKLQDHVGFIDNGKCAICKYGYRLWQQDGKVSGPCSNTDCLSHEVAAALCSDCPPCDYPTDSTRCTECPRINDALRSYAAHRSSCKGRLTLGMDMAHIYVDCDCGLAAALDSQAVPPEGAEDTHAK